MIDSTLMKAHCTAESLLKEEAFSRCISCMKGGLNSNRHLVCDGAGKPLVMLRARRRESLPFFLRPRFVAMCLRVTKFSGALSVWILQASSRKGNYPSFATSANL